MADPADARWMTRALELAAGGRWGASPNPMVGAVVLDGAGRLAGEGFHACWGGPHAEVEALRSAGAAARGGTLYVTLEPCAHHGKTPPCTDAVTASGVRRVVIAQRDPSPAAGGGAERLAAAGIATVIGVGAAEAERLNRRWLRWARSGRPWVTLKAGVSLDGRIATRTGDSRWITGEAARRRSLELRDEHDAILVGVGTVLADDPLLTRRLGRNPGSPWRRVILDSRLRTPLHAHVVQEQPETTLLVHGAAAPSAARAALAHAGVGLLEVPEEGGRPALAPLLERLAQLPVAALLVEGGGEVHGSFVDAGLLDEVRLLVAPLLLGGRGAPAAVAGRGAATLAEARRLVFEPPCRHGDDLELVAVRAEAACSPG